MVFNFVFIFLYFNVCNVLFCSANVTKNGVTTTFDFKKYLLLVSNGGSTLSHDDLVNIIKNQDDKIQEQDDKIQKQDDKIQEQEDKIQSRDKIDDVKDCAGMIGNAVKLIQYKYFHEDFITHFKNLMVLVLEKGLDPKTTLTREKLSSMSLDVLVGLYRIDKKIPKRLNQRFEIFLEWVLFYNEYEDASGDKIPKKYRNGRLVPLVRALRDAFGDLKREDCPMLAKKILRGLYNISCNVVKSDVADKNNFTEVSKYVDAVIQMYEKDDIVNKCKGIFSEFFTHPYALTALERGILEENGWKTFVSIKKEEEEE